MEVVIKKLIITNRKSICLRIDNNGDLIVIAPHSISEDEIKKIVLKKLNWIVRTRQFVLHCNKKINNLNLQEGDTLLYLGENYSIALHNKNEISIDSEKKIFYLPIGDKATLKRKLIQFYLNKAYEILKVELDHWSDVMNLRYNGFRLKNAKRLWGSCGKNGVLNLNWRLVLLPREIIAHIVIHELAHLVYKNHSKQFKYFVAKYSPNYLDKEKWLNENAYILRLFRED
ncbi:MAG: M48 family metallopeptidase [Candidatus Kapaibacteriota bacterium]